MNALPEPTLDQQRVLDRIATQRDRLRTQATARERLQADASPVGPLLAQGIALAVQHPLAVMALVGLALTAGPKRLLRWGGVALPLLLKLRR